MTILKEIVYKLIAPVLRVWLRNSITGKPIKDTHKVLYYDRSQHHGFLFSRKIEYEKEFSAIIMQHMKPGNLVFEIGSNIGQYSLQIAEKIGEKGKLICVEPDSDNFAFLSFNIIKNGCKNVHLGNEAVADQQGQTTFYKDTMTGGRMGSLIREYSGTHFQGKSEEVKTTTIGVLIDQYGIPDFVKVDVEGAEDLIFNNTSFVHSKTTYLIEVREETKASIFEVFNSLGFFMYLLESNLKKVEHVSDIPGFANLLIKHPPTTI